MDNKVLFAVLDILFAGYGVPCFLQGDTKTGLVRLALGFVTCGILGFVNSIFGIIEGIQILMMSDEEYAEKKGTFAKGWPTL